MSFDAKNPAVETYLADCALIVAALETEGEPTAEQKAALGRVGKKLLVDLGGIANSLERIAEAQERLAGLGARPHRT